MLDLRDGVRGVAGRPALTVVVRSSKLMSMSSLTGTLGRLKSSAAAAEELGVSRRPGVAGGLRRNEMLDKLKTDAFRDVRAR